MLRWVRRMGFGIAVMAAVAFYIGGAGQPTLPDARLVAAAPNAPTLNSPGDGVVLTDFGPKLTWINPPGITQYHLQVIPANNDGPGINIHRGSSETSFDIPPPPHWYGLLPRMTYTWRVRVSDASAFVDLVDPSWSPWSERSFHSPVLSSATITPVFPADGATLAVAQPLALRWSNTDANAFYYEVQVSPDPAFGGRGAVASVWHNLIHGGVTDPSNSWRTPELLPGATYYWRVRPRVQGDGTPLAWSPSWSFKTATVVDKWTLWTAGTRLRGANIYQRRVYPELDGPDFMGPGPVGPPYTQQDFDRLAALGANYVNISHPGLFTEKPPYALDQRMQDHLDSLLGMISRAGMFAVISFRTGPGRSEFSFFVGDPNDPEYKDYLNDSVWGDRAAQDGWAAMWRHTAERYRNNPVVVGYDLMVEPNAAGVLYGIYEPNEFYPAYANTLADWNQFHPRISAAIREVDPAMPILTGAMGYSAVAWLPYLQPTGDPRTAYMVHQYEPHNYTHQVPPLTRTYPGVFDIDGDGVEDQFSRAWLENLLKIVDGFVAKHKAPVSVNEFGPMRWEPGAAAYMDDLVGLFEQRSMNHALWAWDPSWEPMSQNDDFNFRHGPDPSQHIDVASSALLDVIKKYWARNTLRP